MSETSFDYERMVLKALRDVVRQALEIAVTEGLAGDRHFYITFLTGAAGVVIPDELRSRFPDEMTIVLQHQFWDLEVERDRFSVGLAFRGVRRTVEVPFAAVTAFSDPSVPFGLSFELPEAEEDDASVEKSEPPSTDRAEIVDNVIRFDRSRHD